MSERVKKVLTVVAGVVLWCVILVAALYAFTTLATKGNGRVADIFGYTPLSVQTDSMSPTFNAGDLIIIKKTDPSALKVGDIVTFHTIIENQYALNTHRIDEIEESDGIRRYVTKGDNNPGSDADIITNGDIVGKYVFRIPKLGRVMDFLSGSAGFLVCIVLPMLLFFIYQVYNLVMIGMKLKKAQALEAAEEAAKIKESAGEQSTEDETARLRAELEEAKRRLAEAEAKKDE